MELTIEITRGKYFEVYFNNTEEVSDPINCGADASFKLATPSIINNSEDHYEENEKIWREVSNFLHEAMGAAQDKLEQCGLPRFFPEEGCHVVINSDQDEIDIVLLKEYMSSIIWLMFKSRTEKKL